MPLHVHLQEQCASLKQMEPNSIAFKQLNNADDINIVAIVYCGVDWINKADASASLPAKKS